jgi:hypothetical protein
MEAGNDVMEGPDDDFMGDPSAGMGDPSAGMGDPTAGMGDVVAAPGLGITDANMGMAGVNMGVDPTADEEEQRAIGMEGYNTTTDLLFALNAFRSDPSRRRPERLERPELPPLTSRSEYSMQSEKSENENETRQLIAHTREPLTDSRLPSRAGARDGVYLSGAGAYAGNVSLSKGGSGVVRPAEITQGEGATIVTKQPCGDCNRCAQCGAPKEEGSKDCCASCMSSMMNINLKQITPKV